MKDTEVKRFTIASGVFLLMALAGWLWYFYPWFGYMEQSSFFCFLPSYVVPFLTQPAGGAELTARFLAQFFISPLGVVAVHLLLILMLALSLNGIFRILKCRSLWFGLIAGWTFLPYWIFAFNGMAGFVISVAYVANLAVAWGCLSFFRFGKKAGIAFSLFMFMLMFHFTGPWAVLVLLPVAVRFPVCLGAVVPLGLFMAFLDARCFVYAFSRTSGLDFWQSCNLTQKTICVVTVLVWIAGIFFNRVRNGKQHYSFRKVWMLFPIWAVLWLLSVLHEAHPLERAFYLSEQYARQERWKEVMDTAAAYFDRHPAPEETADYDVLRLRDMMAINLKLALLKTGTLNSRFFSYGDIAEMNTYMVDYSAAGHYNFASVRFAFQSGLWIPLRIFTNNILNVYGPQNATIQAIIPNSIFWRRYELAQSYLYYQRHTLFYRKEARHWLALANEKASEEQSDIHIRRNNDSHRMWEEEGLDLDAWVQAMYTPASDKTTLEYFTFTQLFYKKLDSLPALAGHYRRLDCPTLPQYMQEALLIAQQYRPSSSVLPQTYSEYAYSPAVVKNYVRAETDRILYQEGVLTFDELQSRYGSTYWFHYYYRRLYR